MNKYRALFFHGFVATISAFVYFNYAVSGNFVNAFLLSIVCLWGFEYLFQTACEKESNRIRKEAGDV